MEKLLFALGRFIFVLLILLTPVFLILLGFDFMFDLKLDFFSSEYSISRILFFLWTIIVIYAYLKNEFGEQIEKII